jgi:hypothetical protein
MKMTNAEKARENMITKRTGRAAASPRMDSREKKSLIARFRARRAARIAAKKGV